MYTVDTPQRETKSIIHAHILMFIFIVDNVCFFLLFQMVRDLFCLLVDYIFCYVGELVCCSDSRGKWCCHTTVLKKKSLKRATFAVCSKTE